MKLMTLNRNAPLWAITSYFNPVSYRHRRLNYRIFREHLQLPLIAVEHSTTGRFDLNNSDADMVIHLDGGDIMWQKERLLNVALEMLPETCRAVAWLDCDVVLRDHGWPSKALAKLKDAILVQPFSSAYEVRLADRGDPLPASPVGRVRPSFAARYAKRELSPEEIRTWRIGGDPVPIHCGYAWAGRTDPLREHGFYDASILGGGTREFAATAIGEIDSLVQCRPRSSAQLEHFLTWARRWASAVDGRVDYVEGELLHLWHGETADRGYGKRYEVLAEFDFDPCTDITATDSGCWRWSTPKTTMHERVAQYFTTRREGGED